MAIAKFQTAGAAGEDSGNGLLLFLGLVAAAGLVYWFATKEDSESPSNEQEEEEEEEEEEAEEQEAQ